MCSSFASDPIGSVFMESQRSRSCGGTNIGAWNNDPLPTSAARTRRRKEQRQHTQALQFVKVNRCKLFSEASSGAILAADFEHFRHSLYCGQTSGCGPGDNWIQTGGEEQWHLLPCPSPISESKLSGKVRNHWLRAEWEEQWHSSPGQTLCSDASDNNGGRGCAPMLDSGIVGEITGYGKVEGCVHLDESLVFQLTDEDFVAKPKPVTDKAELLAQCGGAVPGHYSKDADTGKVAAAAVASGKANGFVENPVECGTWLPNTAKDLSNEEEPVSSTSSSSDKESTSELSDFSSGSCIEEDTYVDNQHKQHSVFRFLQEREVAAVGLVSKRHADIVKASHSGTVLDEAYDDELPHVCTESSLSGSKAHKFEGPSVCKVTASDANSLITRAKSYIDCFSDFQFSLGGLFFLPIPDHLLINEAERPEFEAMCSVAMNARRMHRAKYKL